MACKEKDKNNNALTAYAGSEILLKKEQRVL